MGTGQAVRMIDVTWVVLGLTSFFIVVILYYTGLFLASLTWKAPSKTKNPKTLKRLRFLVLVPAHNEERVVGNLMADLHRQAYPKDLYKAIVVADNCTDNTLQACGEFATDWLKVMVRTSDQRGKGLALDYGFKSAPDLFPNFKPDYVIIFDADNHVPEDFLAQLSMNMSEGCPAIQCNVRTKESTSFLVKLIFYEFLILQRLWQRGKQRLGLCNALAGTGEAIRCDLVESLGFGSSLTDDLDFTMRLALIGEKVEYLHQVAVFDEKPTQLITELRRRTRWSAGHIQASFNYVPRLLWLLRRPSKLRCDALFYLFAIFTPLVLWAGYFLSVLALLGLVTFDGPPLLLGIGLSFGLVPLFLATSYLEGEKAFLKYLVPFLVFLVCIWLIAVPLGLVKALRKDTVWDSTPHGECYPGGK